MPVEVPGKKALASSIERSELLIENLQGDYSGGLVQPDRHWWCARSGKMVHGGRTNGARPPRQQVIP